MLCAMPAVRDPLSVFLDRAARDLLSRAYRAPRGEWVTTRLADPDPFTAASIARMGIDWRGPDNASARGRGGLDARDRWTRALIRAVYYQYRWYATGRGGWRTEKREVALHTGALQLDAGRRVPARGVIPAGRAVRLRLNAGGRTALGHVQQFGNRDRIYDNSGSPAGRWSDVALRDWA
jgi:hypothetical protein